MPPPIVFMDNHSTTPVDPLVVQAMAPLWSQVFGNPGSTSHAFGWEAKELVDTARQSIAAHLHAHEREIVFTSGATESNNLALKGVVSRVMSQAGRTRRPHVVSVTTEHKAVLDPLARLGREGAAVTLIAPRQQGDPQAGQIDLQQIADAITDDTVLVSIMMANNEIGVIQRVSQIASLCHERGVLLHTDATQAVGKMLVDVEQLQVDLLSFSGHKIYGPKGIGGLFVRRRPRSVRLRPQIEGGGQEFGMRSGTLNVSGIVGLAKALELCVTELDSEPRRLASLRDHLWERLQAEIPGCQLNGPALDVADLRLPGNLSVAFADVDGEALMLSMKRLAVSSGSACTSANPEPSHVLRAIGLSEDLTRSSLRFGLGRFNTHNDILLAIKEVRGAVERLRSLGT